MHRMKCKLNRASNLFYIEPWEVSVQRQQWRYIIHAAYAENSQWPSLLADWMPDQIDDISSPYIPFRSVGRPRVRWDDGVNLFCRSHLHINSWNELLLFEKSTLYEIEHAFIHYCDL